MSKEINVVAAAIFQNHRVFAAQRNAHQSHPGAWEFPGGKVEPGETQPSALKRELFEEFGIHAHIGEYLATKTTEDPDRTIHVHLYRVFVLGEEILPREHTAVAWLSAGELCGRTWTQADNDFLPTVRQCLDNPKSIWAQPVTAFEQFPCRASAQHLFRQLQRPWTYHENRPKLGKLAQELLETTYDMRLPEVFSKISSEDGTTRLIYEYPDGARIETIHMPRDVRSPRVTLCLSSQVGCPMGCAFCATAKLGLRRNLTAGEIVAQVLKTLSLLGPDKPHAINLVFMGMGEALSNADNVLNAIQILCDPRGLGIPDRRITLSTCGLLSRLPQLLDPAYTYRPNIAISLNATTNELRSELMPVNKTYPLEQLKMTLEQWPLRSHEKILIEYVLLENINDSNDDARRLVEFVKNIKHNINIIPYNSAEKCTFKAPDHDNVERFMKILQDEGCLATLRAARGQDVGGACGQLIGKLNHIDGE